VTAEEEPHGGHAETTARRLDHPEELLYRQVHPHWIVDGQPSSQAFKPTKKDEGMLSVALGSKATAEEAFFLHTVGQRLASAGTWAVTVGEVVAVELSSYEQPLENNPAHGFIDFRGLGRGATESKAKLLLAKARARGDVYRPTT
jgi:hypothetical protein